ncbi:MAG: hypothetical protein QNK15_02735 [Cycloclasticus sp.]|nr:hypothetical protein [Cycloclasticus sp.]
MKRLGLFVVVSAFLLMACAKDSVVKEVTLTEPAQPIAVSDATDVEAQIERIVEKMKTEPEVKGWLLIGNAYMHLKRYNDAVWAYKEAYMLSNYAAEPRSKLREAMYHAGLATAGEREALDAQQK